MSSNEQGCSTKHIGTNWCLLNLLEWMFSKSIKEQCHQGCAAFLFNDWAIIWHQRKQLTRIVTGQWTYAVFSFFKWPNQCRKEVLTPMELQRNLKKGWLLSLQGISETEKRQLHFSSSITTSMRSVKIWKTNTAHTKKLKITALKLRKDSAPYIRFPFEWKKTILIWIHKSSVSYPQGRLMDIFLSFQLLATGRPENGFISGQWIPWERKSMQYGLMGWDKLHSVHRKKIQ